MPITDINIIGAAIANNSLEGLTLNDDIKLAIDEALKKGNVTTTELLERFIG